MAKAHVAHVRSANHELPNTCGPASVSMPLFLVRMFHIIPCDPATARAGGSSALRVICTCRRRRPRTHSSTLRKSLSLVHDHVATRDECPAAISTMSASERSWDLREMDMDHSYSVCLSARPRGSYLRGNCGADAFLSSIDPPLSLIFSRRIRLWGRAAISYTSFSGHSPVGCSSSRETEVQVRP